MTTASRDAVAVIDDNPPRVRASEPEAAKPPRPRFRPPKKRPIGRIIVVVLVLAVAAGVTWARLRPKPVTTSEVVRGTAIDAVYATATVEALDRVTVKAKVAGSIIELKVREGDPVKKGDLLAVVDSPGLKYQLAKGKAEQWAATQQAGTASPQVAALVAQQKATSSDLALAKEERDRLKKLVDSGSATSSDLDKASNRVTMLEATLAAQEAQAKSLKIDLQAKASGSNAAVSELAAKLADAEVRSPIDGVVLGRSVELGELVPLNGVLFKIGDVTKLVLECSVDEADIGRIAVGKKAAVSLYAFPKQAFHGEVFDIFPDADRNKKSFLVKVRLQDAPAGLRSGMSAEVNVIVAEHAGALLAPAEAIDADDQVWILHGDRVERRKLTLGVRDMLRVEVLGGLAEGDQVVTAGVDALTPNAKVKATYEPPNKSSVVPKSSTGGGGSL